VFQQTVCPDDGSAPISGYCEQHAQPLTEWFSVKQQPPTPDQGLYRAARVDAFTGLIANQYCEDYVEERFYVVPPNPSRMIDAAAAARNWIVSTEPGNLWAEGRGLARDQLAQIVVSSLPAGECSPETPRPVAQITLPAAGSVQQGLIPIIGSANAPNFSHYIVEYGVSESPQAWGTVQGRTSIPISDSPLAQIDLTGLADGPITLRLLVFDQAGHIAETRVTIQVQNPTPTPTPTGSPTETPTLEPTSEATPTVAPPQPTEEPSPTPGG
jgi:hypothetical protein